MDSALRFEGRGRERWHRSQGGAARGGRGVRRGRDGGNVLFDFQQRWPWQGNRRGSNWRHENGARNGVGASRWAGSRCSVPWQGDSRRRNRGGCGGRGFGRRAVVGRAVSARGFRDLQRDQAGSRAEPWRRGNWSDSDWSGQGRGVGLAGGAELVQGPREREEV